MSVQLYPWCFGFWQRIKIAKDCFQYVADVALNHQLVTIGLFPHGAIRSVNPLTDILPQTAIVSEHNTGQRVTRKNRLDVFLINNAVL